MGRKKTDKTRLVTVLHSSPSTSSVVFSTTIRNIGTRGRAGVSHSVVQAEPALESVQNIQLDDSPMLLDEPEDIDPQIPPSRTQQKAKRLPVSYLLLFMLF